jgi:hypothetical protein
MKRRKRLKVEESDDEPERRDEAREETDSYIYKFLLIPNSIVHPSSQQLSTVFCLGTTAPVSRSPRGKRGTAICPAVSGKSRSWVQRNKHVLSGSGKRLSAEDELLTIWASSSTM